MYSYQFIRCLSVLRLMLAQIQNTNKKFSRKPYDCFDNTKHGFYGRFALGIEFFTGFGLHAVCHRAHRIKVFWRFGQGKRIKITDVRQPVISAMLIFSCPCFLSILSNRIGFNYASPTRQPLKPAVAAQ
jgi:hypothetical protein